MKQLRHMGKSTYISSTEMEPNYQPKALKHPTDGQAVLSRESAVRKDSCLP